MYMYFTHTSTAWTNTGYRKHQLCFVSGIILICITSAISNSQIKEKDFGCCDLISHLQQAVLLNRIPSN